jgi:hypothetical protein
VRVLSFYPQHFCAKKKTSTMEQTNKVQKHSTKIPQKSDYQLEPNARLTNELVDLVSQNGDDDSQEQQQDRKMTTTANTLSPWPNWQSTSSAPSCAASLEPSTSSSARNIEIELSQLLESLTFDATTMVGSTSSGNANGVHDGNDNRVMIGLADVLSRQANKFDFLLSKLIHQYQSMYCTIIFIDIDILYFLINSPQITDSKH